MPLKVTPAPALVAVAPVRLAPTIVNATPEEPRIPDVGAIEVSVGPTTVNVTAGLTGVVPIGVVTVTVLVVSAAPAEIVQVALTVVEFEVDALIVQVIPPPAFTAVAPLKLVPETV